MALLDTPTIEEIKESIINQIQIELNQTIPLLPRAFTRVLAKTLAGIFIILYKYAGFILLQMFASRATLSDTEINGVTVSPLTELGRLFGEGDPIGAQSARVDVRLKFSSSLGSTLSAGTKMIKLSSGVTYATTADVTITSDFTQTIEAIQDQAGGNGLGAIGNLAVSDELEYITTPTGALAGWKPTVTTLIRTGTDEEDGEDYRRRVINKMQRPPQGGAYADYFEWGTDAAGIINIYPYTQAPAGSGVIGYCEATPESSGDPDGIPTAAQLASVEDFVELNADNKATRRQVSAFFTAAAITRTAIDVTIQNLQGIAAGDIAAVKAEINAAITERMLVFEPYIVGLIINPRNTVTKAEIAGVASDVARSNGGSIDGVMINRTGLPIADSISVGTGEKFKAGTITYI